MELYFDIHTFNNLNVDFNVEFIDDILTACMNLPMIVVLMRMI